MSATHTHVALIKAFRQGMAEENPVLRRLAGRVAMLECHGRVKDPGLMREAIEVITELVATTTALLNDMGDPDDGAEANLMNACRAAIAKATEAA